MERKTTDSGTSVIAEPETLEKHWPAHNRALGMLVGSDLHGSLDGLEWFSAQAMALQPELVVFLGDFITGRPLSFLREALRDLRTLAPHCCVIPGNWDPREALPIMDIEAYDGLRHLHKHTPFLSGYSFVGLGGSTPTPVGTTPLEMPEDQLVAPLPSLLPADIWLLHNPVHEHCDRTESGMNAGSPALARIYDEQVKRPLLVLSGHIHEARGVENCGSTCFANPGTLQSRQAAWITLDGEKANVELLEG